MLDVYLLLGSNVGHREENLQKAKRLLEFRCGKIVAESGVYETAAWGHVPQNSFLNQAVQVKTNHSPENLLTSLKGIEKETGRVDTVKWGPRVIDIDILLFHDIVYQSPQLTIPHPYMAERRFTLVPLADIAGSMVHPVLQKSVRELLQQCPDTLEVKRVSNDLAGR